MKLVLQIRLLPDAVSANKLRETMARFNEACNYVLPLAFDRKLASNFALQKLYYRDIRKRFGLSAQHAVKVFASVALAVKQALQKKRKVAPVFRPLASVPYDKRLYSLKGAERVSLSTLQGRVVVPCVYGEYQRNRWHHTKKQADLVLRKDGKWFLHIVIEVPDNEAEAVQDFVGVDLGVANIATTDDGEQWSGDGVESVRQHYADQRASLQRAKAKKKTAGKRPRSICRKLARISKRESHFRRNTNHCISKRLVDRAKGTGKGIALESLKGIAQRLKRFRKRQRAQVLGWSFFQLRTFVEYKAQLAGVPVAIVNAQYTSQTCAECGHNDKANRKTQALFACVQCHHADNADINAARNIRQRAILQCA